ncbi:MAG: histidine ammonia-lyase [Candidatus Obscuribacterales bacterium]|nr:histidine ammonia-lyase [Candidatus Obscuribacterales bacterium]
MPSKKTLSPLQVAAIEIDGENLSLAQVEAVSRHHASVRLSKTAQEKVIRSRHKVDEVLKSGKAIYGITTGFGKFKDVFIKAEDSRLLQHNYLLSHAAGTGPAFDKEITRSAMLLRANALAKGFSGIKPETLQLLLDCLNNGIHPCIPEQGSVGASGDLAPLAHLALVLIGEGEAEYQNKVISGQKALDAAGLNPVVLEAKEGLALTNGTQLMAAMAARLVNEAERLAKMADIIGAMSLEALLGSPKAFSEKLHRTRPHKGQLDSASNLRLLLQDSSIVLSHADCKLVQDAYSLRCMPQVHGASRQAINHAREVVEVEINSATDNPLVFDDEVISGGNFHGQPLALILDYLSIAIAELANISERRVERLVNPALSNGLPAFLTLNGGLESGFMIPQYTAAALVSENKSLAHPASVDSIPTSANQEDHVSMGTIAGRKAQMILRNARKVLAIELLCAAQGLDLRMHQEPGSSKEPTLLPSPALKAAHDFVRQTIPHLDHDRYMHAEIAKAEAIICSGELITVVESVLGPLA